MDTSALPHRLKTFLLLMLGLCVLALLPQSSTAGVHGNTGISPAQVLPAESLNYTVGIDWESGRQLTSRGNGYDNIRVRPLGVRYGLWKNLQLGTDLRYSSNSASNRRGPDQSGLESLNLNTKYRWNRNFAVETSLGFGISNDVFPYGGDGFQFGLNLPWRASMGPGSLIGELGYTTNSGKVSRRVEWGGYFNYGLGYQYELTNTVALKTEIAGHGSTVDTGTGQRHLAFRIVPTISMSQNSFLTPSLTMGFSSGSPDLALGVDYTMRFGVTSDRRVPFRSDADRDRRQQARRAGEEDRTDNEDASERNGRSPLVLPGEATGSDTPDSKRNRQRAQNLAEEGRNAFKRGNLDRAISHFEEAVQYDPNNVEILSNLGSLHYRRNNYKQALQYYKRAVGADPQDQYAQLFLGITLQKLGRPEEARKHLKKARNINPSSDAGSKAASRLEALQE